MHKPPPLLTPHRCARLVAWAQAMLAWLATALFGAGALSGAWRLRRYPLLDSIEHLVRGLAICRTIELAHLRERPRARLLHDTLGAGFRRRTERSEILRSIAGSRWRKALKHRDPAQRLQRLLAALADIDSFARRYLVPRAMRRLTRLFPVLPVAPPAVRVASRAAPETCAVNSS